MKINLLDFLNSLDMSNLETQAKINIKSAIRILEYAKNNPK